ncbi:uroporphyrin-3 C-methyltransferase [Chromohalobacter marismortui]|uniref:Uroporphyrin-3 C-methyltransferase n=1 Tax=Chromohalobacter marismortui TaxID=42055 RepID=A0A4R7NF97_9GAMM|nr:MULTISPECIES: uroporphyrinogen-III C-methyltransferase [Chromohalobacter]MCI0510044.1 uroporphyrinogen-III C-methyltransferase [Chromohalobacter sp.]MCI0593797.1 uroporphyrinogen-III C-methyltransferase [Chromohalobacter sp.]TDU18987.1 uroporphyrin-3 C-methyltransferase [Chromohalobacter marismortui]
MSKRQDQDDKNTPTYASTSTDETSQSSVSSETHQVDADGQVADETRGASDKAADAASSKASTTGPAASRPASDAASPTSSETPSASGASSSTAKGGSKAQHATPDKPAKDAGKPKAGSAAQAKTQASANAGGAGNGTSPPAGPTSQSGSGRGLALVALVVAVVVAIVLVLGLGYGWKRLQAQQTQQAELANTVDANAQAIEKLRQRLDRREQAFASLRDDFQAYRKELDANLDKVLAELAEEQEADPREWLYAEAEYLLRLANQRLRLERDVRGAKALLETADQRLAKADNPALIPVRRAIQSELAALDSVPTVDRTGLYLALMAQQEQLATLPLEQEVEEMAAQKDDQAPLKGGWREQLAQLGGELKDLVVIRRHDEALEALVTPEQESYLRQNVRLLLEQAQLALLKAEPKLYQASLGKAITLIERYYDTQQEAVKASLERLESLRDKTIRPELPDISKSQQALQKFMETRLQDNGGNRGEAVQQNGNGTAAKPGDEGDSA